VDRENTSDTRVFSAKVVLFDRDRDIALLRLDSTRHFRYLAELTPRAELANLDVFSPAYAVGCPLGNRPLPTLGEISSRKKRVGSQVFWMLNAPTFFGNSGGGVYQVPTCRLIGVSSMIYTYGKRNPTVVPHMGLFVPLETIYGWLDAQGYSFVYERQPIPRHLRWRLAYLPEGASRPSAASSRTEGVPAPGAGK
jgi:S1-C subfamily serine protease